jgi:hypothetical protein
MPDKDKFRAYADSIVDYRKGIGVKPTGLGLRSNKVNRTRPINKEEYEKRKQEQEESTIRFENKYNNVIEQIERSAKSLEENTKDYYISATNKQYEDSKEKINNYRKIINSLEVAGALTGLGVGAIKGIQYSRTNTNVGRNLFRRLNPNIRNAFYNTNNNIDKIQLGENIVGAVTDTSQLITDDENKKINALELSSDVGGIIGSTNIFSRNPKTKWLDTFFDISGYTANAYDIYNSQSKKRMGGNNKFKPNIIRGGRATNIKGNLYYMSGRKHEAGGIDIGKNPRTGLEVEDGEVVQTDSNGLKVFSAQPILNGNSPAKLVMGGANPAKVFNAQERFKEVNGINDDGTKKKRMGGLSRNKDYGSSKKPYPSVNKKDFAGGGRSYPIPTRADAVDALRLAGLHGRSDVKAKVYKKYPDLKKKRMGGIREDYPTLAGDYYGREEAKTIKALRNARTNPQYQGRNLNLPTLSMNNAYGNLPVTPSNRTAIERTNAKYNTSATKPKTKRQSFNSAFAAARKQGLSEFTWNGKQYGTQVAGSSKPKTNQQTSTRSSITSNNLPEVTVTAPRVNSRLINQLESNRYVPSKPKPVQEHTVKVESNTINPVKRRSSINDKPGKIGYIDNNGEVIYGKSGSNEVSDILSAGFNDMIEYGRGIFNRKKKVGGKVVMVNGNVKSGLVISPSSTGEREKAAVGKDYDFRIDTTKYKIGDTFEYKGKRYKVTGRNAAKPIDKGTDKDVEAAARRDAKGARTDFRNMLERPQYTPDKIESKPKTVTTRSTKVEQPVQTTTTTKQTKVTVPRRGSGKSKSKPAAKSVEPTKPAPKFADLNTMIQGINTRGAQMPTRIEPRTVEGASTNKGVPDVIESPRKRLALFDKLDTNDIIGLAGNIGGSVASAITTRKALNNMEAPPMPTGVIPARMRTAYNVNDQISDINEEAARMMNDINANTSSGRTRLQRLQRVRNQAIRGRKNLVNTKENIELQLQNEDARNRQSVRAVNVNMMNDWRNRSAQFRNTIREQKASSLNNMFSGINAGLQDMLSRIENRRNYNNTLGIYDATHPNTDKRLFIDKGVTI